MARERTHRELNDTAVPRTDRRLEPTTQPGDLMPTQAMHFLRLQQQAGNHAVGAIVQRLRGAPVQRKHVEASYAGAYDANEVREMLNASQGRAGSTGAPGHVREHVKDASGTRT